MTPGEIIDQVWKLPWYKVFCVAIVDDFIFMVKVWPFWALIILITIIAFVWKHFREKF